MFELKYLGDPRILYCPAAPEDSHVDWGNQGPGWTNGTGAQAGKPANWNAVHSGYYHYANYFVRSGHGWGTNLGNGTRSRRRAGAGGRNQKDKADTVLATDIMVHWTTGTATAGGWAHGQGRRAGQAGRHAGDGGRLQVSFEGGNVLFNDGHAEWRNAEDTKYRWFHRGWGDFFW
jgi:prepilin-type processing-associated H-X9-DG protein